MKKDSLDLTEKNRELILKTCKKIQADKIVITHGTDTMVKTAKKLSGIKNKTIVLTGSIKPEKFSDSDAPINVGMAIAAVQSMPRGIYIVMNGRIYNWNSCKKDSGCNFVENKK